jgi:hypothetical protein
VVGVGVIYCMWGGTPPALDVSVLVNLDNMVGNGWRVTFSNPDFKVTPGGRQIALYGVISYPTPPGVLNWQGPKSYQLSGTLTFLDPAGNATVPVSASMSCT